MVRANRYALAAAQDGEPLDPTVRALHGCENPVCVRVSERGETGLLHVVGGTQRDNMEMMGRAAVAVAGRWCAPGSPGWRRALSR